VIDYVSGQLHRIEATAVVISLQAGLGLRIECTPAVVASMPATGAAVTLLTAAVHVQDGLPRLIGFETEEARQLFLLLTSVQGIGAGTALKVMGAHKDVRTIVSAIRAGDEKRLKAKGVGPKLSAKIVHELKDKVGPQLDPVDVQIPGLPKEPENVVLKVDQVGEDAYRALRGLEFDAADAKERLKEARKHLPADHTTEDLVRAVLVRL
jgi:Holliday junction DNA helicase RuvA